MNPTLFTRFDHLTTAELNALVEQMAARRRELYREYKNAHLDGASVSRRFKAVERIQRELNIASSALHCRPDNGYRSLFASVA